MIGNLISAFPLIALACASPLNAKAVQDSGAPSARLIRDVLVYEQTYGITTVGDAMGMVERRADYDSGRSRTTVMGMSMDVIFDVANPRCTKKRVGEYACVFDMSMGTSLSPAMKTRASHTFVSKAGKWRSPSFRTALIASRQRSGSGGSQRNCTVQGFGTLEGPHLADQQGLRC